MPSLHSSPLQMRRMGPILTADPSRVLARPFRPATDDLARRIAGRVMALEEAQVEQLLGEALSGFGRRHRGLETLLRRRYAQISIFLEPQASPSIARQLLLGAYFTHEYSTESAALFNPSIVPHPDQSGLAQGELRFVLSLRGTGEGHISSIGFRSGILAATPSVTLTPTTTGIMEPERVPDLAYAKGFFAHQLQEAGVQNDFCHRVLAQLHDDFTLKELHQVLLASGLTTETADATATRAARGILSLAESNYEVDFAKDSELSERVLFPSAPSQSNGIEDARFVQFTNDDGTRSYFATYTAYDGKIIQPQLLETSDFLHFRFSTLIGPAIANKGMALFPRKIGGQYVMLSRQDDENILIMRSDRLYYWHAPQRLLSPSEPWEFFKIGNCGSPMETTAGWLVLTHGVGAMRRYCLGACLLDREDPTRVLARLEQPLLVPLETERDGYVPNVVYSCGGLLHGGHLILPYAMSDSSASFATIPLERLMAAMR